MARPTDDPKTHRMELRLSPGFVEEVDNWRRHQDDIPARSEAIRRLVERGLLASSLLDQIWQLVQEGIITREVFDSVVDNAGIQLSDFTGEW